MCKEYKFHVFTNSAWTKKPQATT